MTCRSVLCGMAFLLIVVSGLTSADGNSRAGDWPQFRGPNRDDISTDTGLLKKWPKAGPPVEWQATGVGSGYSSVAVADGRVYTMGNKESVSHLFAVDGK